MLCVNTKRNCDHVLLQSLDPFSFSCDAMSMFQKRGKKKWSLNSRLFLACLRVLMWNEHCLLTCSKNLCSKKANWTCTCSKCDSKGAGPKTSDQKFKCPAALSIHVRAAWPHLTWTDFPLVQRRRAWSSPASRFIISSYTDDVNLARTLQLCLIWIVALD